MPVTSAGRSHAPYEASVTMRVCSCRQPPKVLAVGRNLDRIITIIDGYWCVYLGFFGDQQIWVEWIVTDVRDGRIMWRNGRRTAEETPYEQETRDSRRRAGGPRGGP